MEADEKERIVRTAAREGRDRVKWSDHALRRARQRSLDVAQVTAALVNAEVIEDYLTRPGKTPDCLCLCQVENEPLHAVVAILDREHILVVTVYRPSAEEWSDDFRTRV